MNFGSSRNQPIERWSVFDLGSAHREFDANQSSLLSSQLWNYTLS